MTKNNSQNLPPLTPTSKPEKIGQSKVWIFDLDNTLYPAKCNLFAEVDKRMGAFISQELGVPLPYARQLQKSYYRQFGTTLAGLMHVHKIKPQPFLEYVHDIDISVIPEAPELREAIYRLPGRKIIFTNGSRAHAERVSRRLGILDLFEGITDIVTCNYEPKPSAAAFDTMIKKHGVLPHQSAMFEDLPQNLKVPHQLGMSTVLVLCSSQNHPDREEKWFSTQVPDHVHYQTEELSLFLNSIEIKNEAGS
ncbi:MAG: pyrimidine 5'-nucleotidase [Hyphomicrobium sp.]